jgi:5-methylcytosine-specific restriction enzyme A
LDDAAWAVSEFDFDARRAIIVRGMAPVHPHSGSIDLELTAFEGWKRRAFIWHRHREAILRRAKIAQVKEAKSGRLTCQVPRCNFDFGKDMAHWVKATPTFTTLYR